MMIHVQKIPRFFQAEHMYALFKKTSIYYHDCQCCETLAMPLYSYRLNMKIDSLHAWLMLVALAVATKVYVNKKVSNSASFSPPYS